MDIVINSAIQSPLVRTLSSTHGKAKNFTFHLKDNIPPVSFGKVEISPDGGSSGSYNRNYKFKIPQYGYWRGFLLKYTAGELGLGTALINDIYSSISTAYNYDCKLYSQHSTMYTSYSKLAMFALARRNLNSGSLTAPQTQYYVPQGFVSAFDGNVRSGNFDPWESMWIRLCGGTSYGNHGVLGSFPYPTNIQAKGDARISPFRVAPRMPVLNAFGRNVANLGNMSYDPADPSYNFSNSSNGGYCLNDAHPGNSFSGSVLSSYSLSNNLGYYTSSSSSILSGTVDSTNLVCFSPSTGTTTSTVGNVNSVNSGVPFGSTVDTSVVGFATSGTLSAVTNNIIGSSSVNGVPNNCIVDNVATPFCLTSATTPTGSATISNTVVSTTGYVSSVPYGCSTSLTFPAYGGTVSVNPLNTSDIKNYGICPFWASTSTQASNVPTSCTSIETIAATASSGDIFYHFKVPYNSSAVVGGVPYNVTRNTVVATSSNTWSINTGVPYSCSNTNSFSVSPPVSQSLTTPTVPVYSTSHANCPYSCATNTCPTGTATTLTGVPYNVSTSSISGTGADNLTQSSAIDYSFLTSFDGAIFQQIPYYKSSGGTGNLAFSTTQPLGFSGISNNDQTAQVPFGNSNLQMRNRFLGQRLANTYDWSSQANLSKHLGAMMAKQITISTHSRVIQTIYPLETLSRIYRMPTDEKRKWLSLIRPHIVTSPSSIQAGDTQTPGYTGPMNLSGTGYLPVDTTNVTWQRNDSYSTYRTWTCYFPCFFSFFEDVGNNLDTRFIENIEIDVQVNDVYNIYDPCDLGISSSRLGTTLAMDNTNDDRSPLTTYQGYNTQEFRKRVSVIDQSNLKVSAICYFHNFHESTNESIRRLNYKPNIPSHILGYNTYREMPVFLTAQQIVQGSTININLQCTNLVTEVIFMVRRRQKDVKSHPQLESFPFENCTTTLPISSVSLTASGQLIYQATGVECLLADQWDFCLGSIKSGSNTSNDSSIYADAHESYYAQSKRTCDGFFGYRIPFSFSQDRSYNSGSVAFETLNNPILTIVIPPLHGWVIQDDNLAFERGSLFNLSENLNQRECDTQTVFDNDFEIQVYENYFQLNRIDSNTGVISKSLDM